MSKDQENVVPSHGYTVDNTKEYISPKAESQQQSATTDQAPAGQQTAADPAPAGQQAAADPAPDGQQAGTDKQADPGGDILSSMAAQLQQITQQLSQGQQGQAGQPVTPQQNPMDVLTQQIEEIKDKASRGEITYEEMLSQTAPIIKQQAVIEVQQQIEADAQQRQVQDAQGQFLQQYPDFAQFVQSPEAQVMVQSNPVLDNVSAYFAAREAKAAEENKALQAQIATLTQQVQNSIKTAASTQANVVGGESGESVGVPTVFRGDGLDPQRGGLAALQRVRQTQQ